MDLYQSAGRDAALSVEFVNVLGAHSHVSAVPRHIGDGDVSLIGLARIDFVEFGEPEILIPFCWREVL